MEQITTRLITSWWRNGSVQELKLPEPEHSQVQMLEPTQPRIRFDLEKLNDTTVMSAFQAALGGRFAPLVTLVDEDADLDSMVTHFNKAVTDTAAELLGKPRRKRTPWATFEILDLCNQRRDLKKKKGEPEGARD